MRNTLAMTKRAAISLPDELFQRVERQRKRAGKDRSSFIQEALGDYLARTDEDAKVKAYFDGYARVPDDDADFRGVAAYSLTRLRRGR